MLFVIIIPAVCVACYHYISFHKGWDADDLTFDADIEISESEKDEHEKKQVGALKANCKDRASKVEQIR